MSPSDLKIRFDELCAGRATGDLTHEEERELVDMCRELGVGPDPVFDWISTELEIHAVEANLAPMPEALSARLHEWADGLVEPPALGVVPLWRRLLVHPLAGWAAAAAITLAWIVPRGENPVRPAVAENRLRSMANDLIESTFSGLGDFKHAGGTVIWSDSLQQGFMKLTGIPANDPSRAQYQLWIVDPLRDADAPVDGGVFNIPAGDAPVVVPIAAKLALSKPKAFVITLEQPGGVVKSKQEKPVALAKNG